MNPKKLNTGGGWPAIHYALKMAYKAGGLMKFYSALERKNACKACALGKGGAKGGLIDEIGQGFQVCKKSMQAQAQDMQPGIPKSFFEKTSLETFAGMSGKKLESLGRLINPLYLPEGSNHFQVLSWPQAYETLLQHWRDANPERSFFYSSGRSSNEAAFLIQLLVRQWGSNNINNCAYYCHQASGLGLSQSLGGGTSTVQLDDITKADLFVLIGANPASNHPRLLRFLANLRRRGGKVVVINPFREKGLQRFNVPSDIRSLFFGSEIANLYLQPHCGGDLAFLKAALLQLWQRNEVDKIFLETNCDNLPEFQKDLEAEELSSLLEKSGLGATDLESFTQYLQRSRNTIFAWGMGITQQAHGVQSVRTITNLALAMGMVGKPGAGLLPLRGHSNVQGVATVGVVPQVKPQMAEALVKHLKTDLPTSPGLDTFHCVDAAFKGEMDFAMLLGGNLYGASPNQKWAGEALRKISFTASLSTTLNLGHIYGRGKSSLILPVRARDEEKQATSQESMFNFVRLSKGGAKAPAPDLPSESEIYVHVGKALLGEDPIPWPQLSNNKEVRKLIADAVPNMQPMEGLDSENEFTIPGRIKHTPTFATPSGKAVLAVVEAPDARPREGHFNLMTMRSEGQFNTIVYEEEDIYRGANHRLTLFMSQEDVENHGFSEGQWVMVESEVGKLKTKLIAGPIRKGNVGMYFPEANVLVPGNIDPQSKTPSYKRIAVRVTKEG